jgi:hypothetical protein
VLLRESHGLLPQRLGQRAAFPVCAAPLLQLSAQRLDTAVG